MSSADRFPYQTATVLDQDLLDNSHDNLANQLEMITDIENPAGGFIRASDRNKYVGSTFYEALLIFPNFKRTIGEWLSGTLEFSPLQLSLSNVDGRFNSILPAGADYDGWIGRSVEVKLGLRDVASTYRTIFKGEVSDKGGFSRDTKTLILKARDDLDKVNKAYPTKSFITDDFPDLEEELVGKGIPFIYGSWTTNIIREAVVPCFVVNGLDDDMNGNSATTTNISLFISENANTSFDSTSVHVRKGENLFPVDSADITAVSGDNNAFEIVQNGITTIEGGPLVWEKGDLYFCKLVGKDLSPYTDNPVWIARDILITHGGLVSGDFDANWATFRDKSSPAESDISTTKCRVHRQESIPALEEALSILEQIRLETFVDVDRKFKINSLHFDDWIPPASISHTIKNWDLVRESLVPRIDQRNNFNRSKGIYNLLPDVGEDVFSTATFRNQPAIDQANSKEIFRRLVFPNLYEEATVILTVKEMLKLASSYLEVIDTELTWRSMLEDVGGFVKISVTNIGSVDFEDVPAMFRDFGFDPNGLKIIAKIWSFQMVPFPGYTPGFNGTTGGSTATITQET